MLIERYNEAAALAALGEPLIETRICVSIKPEAEIFRFVKDTTSLVIPQVPDDWNFHPVPYVEFSPITSGDGQAADTGTITLDGANIVSFDPDQTVDDVLQSILAFPLRDRPIQIGLLVLNISTLEVIGLIPQFVGFVDNVPLTRSKENGSVLDIHIASFRAFAQRRIARVYSDTDHQARFGVLDRCARWISDAVNRRGKYKWNSESASGSGVGGGSSGSYTSISDSTNIHLQ